MGEQADPSGARRIQRLDNITANQIAAGEVIERPVSVVKELVENALDAGGSVIRVEYRDGGLSSIRVTDNGGGIEGADLALAVERHATSKLRGIQDLEDLSTLGFRGEALASIASVAGLEIETRRNGDIEGRQLLVKGGDEAPQVRTAGCPVGTRVTVEHLFYNTPARLKFMKSAGYEGGLIHDLMIQMALGYPGVGFRLENQGKTIFDTLDVNKMEDLVELFYGMEARRALVPVESPASKGRLSGWVTAPPYSRGSRKGLHVYINGRRVGVRDMLWSIEKAYEYLLPRGRFPLAILSFRLPGSLLDVNVHPGKLEVRINDPDLNPSVTRVIRTALSGGGPVLSAEGLGGVVSGSAPDNAAFSGTKPAMEGLYDARGAAYTGRQQDLFARSARDWASLYDFTGEGERRLDGLIHGAFQEAGPAGFPEADKTAEVLAGLSAAAAVAEEAEPGYGGVRAHTEKLRALAGDQAAGDFSFGPHIGFNIAGQLHGTFILAEVGAGLLIVDQHVAHERILYEEYAARGRQSEPAQMLLQPPALDLTTGEEDILIRHILLLNELGYVPERFGPRQYLLRSAPAGSSADPAVFLELLDDLGRGGEPSGLEEARQKLLVMNACKAAVKASTPLSTEEMNALLAGLRKTSHPMTCPHGRPIMYLLPYRRLIQAFGRSS
ncbi:MAG: DNA mismatch repair endonuclease MutL [Clostridiales bacterium]|nr:DNA mismatch repair endonuclease MutL [Clostridiales bacterium]